MAVACPGKVAHAIDPTILKSLAENYDVIIVSGTNGKTLTTSLIVQLLKQKYPTLNSKVEFFTSNSFVGNSNIEITYSTDELKGRDIFLAVKKALVSISSYISTLKQEFVGSTEFTPKMLKDVIKDKKIYMEKIDYRWW